MPSVLTTSLQLLSYCGYWRLNGMVMFPEHSSWARLVISLNYWVHFHGFVFPGCAIYI